MKIRILSDLHIDVNEDYPLTLKNKDIFTLVAGDTAGNPQDAIDWIRHNIHRGLIITGNHLVYNQTHRSIPDLKHDFAAAFPLNSPVTYLDQMTGTISKEIDGKLFIGTTLYTNYCLYPDISQKEAMMNACHPRHGMNDFRYGLVREDSHLRALTPADYLRWFIESFKEMTRLVESNPQKEIVIITHHCPSPKCCLNQNPELRDLNPSYASNLEDFIRQHPNIKLWVTGHAHHQNFFKIGNCLVVQNTRGYEGRREADHFNPNTFVDTKTWQLTQGPFRCVSWEKQRQHDFERLFYQAAFSL